MKEPLRKLVSALSPILGAGAIGACPLCWVGSASLLTYIGLGVLIPVWRAIAFGLLGIGLVGFLLDLRVHRNIYPVALLLGGGLLLYIGRYVLGGGGFTGWPIWGPGALLVVAAVVYNKYLFRRKQPTTYHQRREHGTI
ncbi:hypothetical protein HYZ64_01090 [Candidatus Berkelbacteria bacterium]|nr:hypothetical protein [Candidatus Berkelbacteria bacterium]